MGEPLSHTVAPTRASKDLKGAYVVTGTQVFLTQFAEHSIVVVDRGADHGVKVGNLFTIVRQNDFMDQDRVLSPSVRDEAYPVEDVGTCMAFEVKSQATTCLIVNSIREIVKGDHVELRASGGNRQAMR
jgi:Flagellar assembly protein T, C-terminal domain